MGNNSFTETFADGAALTQAELETALQSLKLDISNTTSMTAGSSSGQFLKSNGDGAAASFASVPDPLGPNLIRNYGLQATAASGILTVSLKTKAGNNPTTSDYIDFTYSSNGTTSATYNAVTVTGAVSLAVNASATLGTVGTSAQSIYVYGYYNTATSSVKLAVSKRSDLDNGSSVAWTIMSASADTAGVGYATAALTVMPRLLGVVSVAQNSSGAWQTPSKVNVFNSLPPSPLERNRAYTTSAARIGQVAISGSSGNWDNASTSVTSVTNLSVSLTTTGRPVQIFLQPDGTTNVSTIGWTAGSGSPTGGSAIIRLFRGSSAICVTQINTAAPTGSLTHTSYVPPGAFTYVDVPAAGTYTYAVKANANLSTGDAVVQYVKLVAYEI